MDDCKTPVQTRKKADFRGTVSFASLNAHNSVVRNSSINDCLGSCAQGRPLESVFRHFGLFE